MIGHKGNLVFGELCGKQVMCLQGRFHPYEHNMDLALVSFQTDIKTVTFKRFQIRNPIHLIFL